MLLLIIKGVSVLVLTYKRQEDAVTASMFLKTKCFNHVAAMVKILVMVIIRNVGRVINMPFDYNKTEPEHCLGCGRKLTAAERAEGIYEKCGGEFLVTQ